MVLRLMNRVLDLAHRSDTERYIAEALPWVHEAGNPYFDWIFGGPEAALDNLEAWMKRPSSEVSIQRTRILLQGDRVVGGFLALGGEDLQRCIKADTLALLSAVKGEARRALLQRMAAVRDLFPRVAADEFYLSKMGVASDLRQRGVGRQVVKEFIAAGLGAKFRRFRLNVHQGNVPALALYRSSGFHVVHQSTSSQAKMTYLSMLREIDIE